MKTWWLLLFAVLLPLSAKVVVKKYSDGKLKSEVNVKNNKREGLAKGYYKNGKLKYETYFKNDKREGVSKSYYDSGELKSEKIYKNGMLNGTAKEYYKDGKLKSKFEFVDDLPLSGTSYNKDGSEVK